MSTYLSVHIYTSIYFYIYWRKSSHHFEIFVLILRELLHSYYVPGTYGSYIHTQQQHADLRTYLIIYDVVID